MGVLEEIKGDWSNSVRHVVCVANGLGNSCFKFSR